MKKPAWALAAVAAAAVGVIVIAAILFSRGTGGGSSGRTPGAAPTAASGTPSAPAPRSAFAGRGSRLLIPSIGTDATVVPEGATGAGGGSLSIPESVREVGWWDGIRQSPSGTVQEKVPAPGEPGVALLAGHVDSAAQGPGALYRLARVKPGAAITLRGQHGKVSHWKVTRVQVVLKSALPASLFADTGTPRLALVSCGGPFDSATGHYLDNVIAWAVPA